MNRYSTFQEQGVVHTHYFSEYEPQTRTILSSIFQTSSTNFRTGTLDEFQQFSSPRIKTKPAARPWTHSRRAVFQICGACAQNSCNMRARRFLRGSPFQFFPYGFQRRVGSYFRLLFRSFSLLVLSVTSLRGYQAFQNGHDIGSASLPIAVATRLHRASV